MVLSRKKLKKQKLLAQANDARNECALSSQRTLLPLDQPLEVNASEEPRLSNPGDGEETAIAQSEIERYHNCLEKILRGESLPKQKSKRKKQTDTELAGAEKQDEEHDPQKVKIKRKADTELSSSDAMAKKQEKEQKSLPSAQDTSLMYLEPKKTRKNRRKNDREVNSSKQGSIAVEQASFEHANSSTLNGVYHKVEHIEEKTTALSVKDNNLTVTKTVYVGGIPFYSSEDDIMNFFQDCGTISSATYKTFPDTGKFRGIALITFKTEVGAQRALAMDGASMESCFLKIRPCSSTPKEVAKLVHREPPKKTEGYTRAYIGNLSWDITEDDIRGLFVDCKIDAIRFSLNKTTGEFQGFGHVDFSDDESLERALKLNQELVLGRPIKIAYAVTKNKSEQETKKITTKFEGKKW